MKNIKNSLNLREIKENYIDKKNSYKHELLICKGAGCVSCNCQSVIESVKEELEILKISNEVNIIETGCMGLCSEGPVMLVVSDDTFYTKLDKDNIKTILKSHLIEGEIVEEKTFYDKKLKKYFPNINDIDFFNMQVKIALRNSGKIEYANIDSYIAADGYKALCETLTQKEPMDIVNIVKESGLKGRGGAGFPTGIKFEAGYKQDSDVKYIVCNADEGDPGAFMDRSIIEGDPHTLIESLAISGYAIGANTGYVYIRAEYPIAIERLEYAIKEARQCGLLGDNIFASDFSFDIEIRIGAGAFVCGEETALLASIEGERGEPRQKPPFPFESGLFGKPTIINNVETLASITPIVLNGSEWFRTFGTETSKGTKVFALAGDIENTGIVEVEIGIPIGDLLFKIGGGVKNNKNFKTAQIGGPSGGCITKENLNTKVDYHTLRELGAIMGSGGLVVLNEDACMVDTARYFMDFVQDESCGKCIACRVGTKRMLEILERITTNRGKQGDIEKLIELGNVIKNTSMCGLGQTAPNPVLSAIEHFREEFEEHINSGYCRAGVCSEMFISPCENTCPASVNVPGYVALISQGNFIDAYDLIRRENPLPSVCGRICTRPCEDRCRRSTVDESVSICYLKRFAADYAYKNKDLSPKAEVVESNGKSVAIIGSSASGLTCGYYLAKLGYKVDIYERENIAGGVLAYGIPEYRLPLDVLEREIESIKAVGVNIILNTSIGTDVMFDELRSEYDSIYVATGTLTPKKINIDGEDLDGVLHGITYLKAVKSKQDVRKGKNIAVVGGGNTAIDSARTAIRLGAESVTILYRRTKEQMPASKEEIQEALEEGVKILDMTNPVEFIGDENGKVVKIKCAKMEYGDFDKNGRRGTVSVENEYVYIDVDLVITAISQHSDLLFVKAHDIKTSEWGTFEVDNKNGMTSLSSVFAGGDCVNGPDTVIRAIADAKRAAIGIDVHLGGKGVLNKGRDIIVADKFDEDDIVELNRFQMGMAEMTDRTETFEEVEMGFHKLNAIAESMRCLRCDRR